MNTRRRSLWAVAALAACLATALPATVRAGTVPPAPAPDPAPTSTEGDGEVVQSWALTPAAETDDPDANGNRPDLAYESEPGRVIEDAVTLYNFGTEQMLFKVYATDAFNADDGRFDILPGSETPTDVGSWVKIGQELITVPAGKQVTIPITLTVPAEAAAGDHAGAIVASSETVGTGENGSAVVVDRRTGTRLYLRVNGPLSPQLAVTGVDTTYHHSLDPLAGSATVSFQVENRGNVRLGGTGSVSVGGPFGLGEQTVPTPELPELLPGEKITMVVDVPDVAALFLESTHVEITPTGADDVGDLTTSEGEAATFAPPLSVLLVLLAGLFALLAWRRFRRHQRAATDVADAGPGADADLGAVPVREHQPT